MHEIRADLQEPAAFPLPRPERVELIETHVSWVFLAGREVYKVKKPVNLGFLDFSTPDLRKSACEAEVRLNRRLAPDVYLGVAPITRSGDGSHRVRGAGTVVDWAVHMKRLPDGDRADWRLAHGSLDSGKINGLASHLADFHSRSRCDAETSQFGAPGAVERNIRENFEQTRPRIFDYLARSEVKEVKDWQLSFLERHRDRFEARIQAQRIRDGHGDLRLEQIYLDDAGKITILDCIEFNDRFRYADVCSDLAFLSMDLRFHGRMDLAEDLLARYARDANDFDLYGLVDFYESYRAYVRGKVAMLLAQDPGISETLRSHARVSACRYFALSLWAHRFSARQADLIVVGGLPASGKSAIAEWIGRHFNIPVIDSDRTRKYLAGVPPTRSLSGPAWEGAYTPEFSERVYREVFRRAEVVLGSGRSVILDATFPTVAARQGARQIAAAKGASFRFVECRAPADIRRRRLREREHQPGVSDARVALFDAFSARFEPVRELSGEERLVLDTSRPFGETTSLLEERLFRISKRLSA